MPLLFTNVEYADMVFIYGFCDGNAEEAALEYRRRYPKRRIQPVGRLFQHVYRHLRETGCFPGVGGTAAEEGTEEGQQDEKYSVGKKTPQLRRTGISTRLSTARLLSVHLLVKKKAAEEGTMDPSQHEVEETVEEVECKTESEFLCEEEVTYPDSSAFADGHPTKKRKHEDDVTKTTTHKSEKVEPMLKDLSDRSKVLYEKRSAVEDMRLRAEEARLKAFNKMASFFEDAGEFLDSYGEVMRATAGPTVGCGSRGSRGRGQQTVKED